MKSKWHWLGWLLLLSLLTAACSPNTEDREESSTIQLQGPALIMFYTDG